MATYLVAQIRDVRDPEGFGEYRQQVVPLIERYGGIVRVAGAEPDVVEGDWNVRLVIIEFPDAAQARAWYECADYQPMKALRQRSAELDLAFVEGL